MNANRLKILEARKEEIERQGSYEESMLGYITYFTYEKWCFIVDRIEELKNEMDN